MILVTAAILERDGRVLIARRRSGLAHGDFWEFPGGKVDAGETPRQCLRRELKEELDIEVQVGEHLATHTHDDGNRQMTLMFYRVAWIAGSLHLKDHSEARWVAPRRLEAYEFTPADRWFADRLRRHGIAF